MEVLNRPAKKRLPGVIIRALLTSLMCVSAASLVSAEETDAKKILKGMSDYVASQNAISFNYDADLELMTKDDQKLSLLSSGSMVLNRPDKVRFTRAGGFADLEGTFDGKTLALLGKNANIYVQVDMPGSFDQLVSEMQEKLQRPLPAADLLLTNSYDELTSDVIDIKDLGSGVVGGVECDHLAFRKKEVDFEIWIAQGSTPYPCRFSIASPAIPGDPQYSVQFRDWKVGSDVAKVDFTFKNPGNATKVEIMEIRDKLGDLPGNFKLGDGK